LAVSFNGLMGRLRDLQLTLEERVRDRTEQLSRANADLEEAKEAAEISSRAKGQFLANVSHEIRTPMTAVLGMNELMLATSLDLEQREYAETIHQSAETLLSLLNDILDFSKMEADKLDLEWIPFAMERCARSVVGIFSSKATEKGVGLRLEYDSELPTLVRGDPGRCQQVLMNLVSNAVKFTGEGEVVLSLRREGVGSQSGRVAVVVEVRDTGVGMSEEELSRLLKPFAQADLSTTRRYGGSGLGLVICDKLVSLMGGRLTIESRRGQGTTVRFCVELEEALGARVVEVSEVGKPGGVACGHEIPARSAGRSLRVLVVEDTVANQKLLRRLLEKAGHVCDLAAHGEQAVELMQGDGYDLVLMDCQMPVMDGFEATRRIRAIEREEGRARTPIVALTASAMKGDREACLEAGMDDYLTKPIVMQGLFSMLERLGGVAGGSCGIRGVPMELGGEGEPLDLEAVRRMVGSDPEVLKELLGTFLVENMERLRTLRVALKRGDVSAVRSLAHGVKSASLNFHAGAMASVARELESRAKAGELGSGERLLNQLEEELRRIEAVEGRF
jgi:signal transduction histidine kinase/CheY-like chemotaxis protein/HPt (histidine-containing phosphotransfer) domain-containing protein